MIAAADASARIIRVLNRMRVCCLTFDCIPYCTAVLAPSRC